MTYHIDETPEIEVVHLTLGTKSTFIELLVNGASFWAEVCNCCGEVLSLGCSNGRRDIIEKFEEDIYEFIYELISNS